MASFARALAVRARSVILRSLAASRVADVVGPARRGAGVILCLHNVVPEQRPLGVHRSLDMTVADLEALLACLRGLGYAAVTLDEVAERLRSGDAQAPRFVCYTLDDGYADNLRVALPVFRRHGTPFAVYVTTGFIDGEVSVWCYALERLVAGAERLGGRRTVTRREKVRAFRVLEARLLDAGPQEQARLLEALFPGRRPGAGDLLTPEQLRELAADSLVTIGAHSHSHPLLRRLAEPEARAEIEHSKQRLEGILGRPVRHFAYPYGSRAACGAREEALVRACGFDTAATTDPRHVRVDDRPTALPRMVLGGEHDPARMVRLLLTDWFGTGPD